MFDLPFGDSSRDRTDDAAGPSRDAGPGTTGAAPEVPTADDGDGRYVPRGEFEPETLPDPGAFVREGASVATGEDHVEVRRTARELFCERGVRDATFGYVLTALDRDRRHPDAGFRYGRDGDRLRVEFVPTTGFCPQGGALALATFRAWNADRGAHRFDLVRVRVGERYRRSDTVNERLAAAESVVRETGTLPSRADPGELGDEAAAAVAELPGVDAP